MSEEQAFIPWPARMSDLDVFSDAELLLKTWWKALRLQENRLLAETPDGLSADIRFAVFASSLTVQCCELFVRFNVPGVDEALSEYRRRQPAARQLRNALEHFDEYLVGDGLRGQLGHVWFPFGAHREDGRVLLSIPPLPATPHPQAFDVTQLIVDTMWLHGAVTKAINDDLPRRMRGQGLDWPDPQK